MDASLMKARNAALRFFPFDISLVNYKYLGKGCIFTKYSAFFAKKLWFFQ